MKIFLSALENAKQAKAEGGKPIAKVLTESGVKMLWNLMSYYYIKGKNEEIANYIRDHSELVIIDSGAHSFQFGVKQDWEKYTKDYAEFIKRFDRPNVVGYFEMDIENVIGYDKVLYLRSILESVSNKIIPVWHPLRGINEYEKMCKQYAGKLIAIGGFKGTDIKDDQFLMFIKVARKYGCKVHCLGMTRTEVLDRVPFDYTDSSSWSATARHGAIGQARFRVGKVTREFSRTKMGVVFAENYKQGIKMQRHYHRMWQKECKD
jgi:hypothetical protein